MNKRPARNQIEGSVVMGVGTVLFEKRSYDRRGGEACWPSVMRLEPSIITSPEAIRVMEQLFLLWTDFET
jgi:xanthine dehydrogenase YagR molybdenum-binding subunit